jgi:hypothetical protein
MSNWASRQESHRNVHDPKVPKGKPDSVHVCGNICFPTDLYKRHKIYANCKEEARYVRRVRLAEEDGYVLPVDSYSADVTTSGEFQTLECKRYRSVHC